LINVFLAAEERFTDFIFQKFIPVKRLYTRLLVCMYAVFIDPAGRVITEGEQTIPMLKHCAMSWSGHPSTLLNRVVQIPAYGKLQVLPHLSNV
jgi:hypothetical protein